ncbi:MAG: MECDP-synthase [Agarilytica sp.]
MMLKFRFSSVLLATIVGLSACGGDDQTSSNDAPINRTHVIFSPATSELPIPSDLQFSSETAADGTMNAGTDPENPVITGIDFLDGNSVLAPFDIAFDGSLNTAQTLSAANFVGSGASVIPNPNQNIFLLPLEYPSGDGLSQASIGGSSVEVPTFAEAIAFQTAAAVAAATEGTVTTGLDALADPVARGEIISLDGGSNNVLRITPLKPLQAKTKYLVVLTNIEDSNGELALASESYDFIKAPDTDLNEFGPERAAGLLPLRGAIQGWETLAAGYFGFQQSVYDAAGSSATAPSADDIIFAMTFTTGGTTDVLTYNAAPEAFFVDSLSAGHKKDAIVKLVSGQYSLDGSTTSESLSDIATALEINRLLTLDEPSNPLYNTTIAGAIAAGADFATIAADASAAFLMQKAAAEAAISVQDTGGAIALTAAGTVQAIAAGFASPVETIFPVPAPRTTNFYRADSASDISAFFPGPATIYQGEITLPYYQQGPDGSDLSPLKAGSWVANAAIGAAIDAGQGNDPGTTPPSDMITYRYPFPTKQSDNTVPVIVTTPFEALSPKPADGWPVIIFAHGITSERTSSLLLGNALASSCLTAAGTRCFATIAIDQPLHGIAPGGSAFATPDFTGFLSVNDPDAPAIPAGSVVGDNVPSLNLTERHFDATADAATNPIPMDYAADFGSSGSLFVNLTNFANARDNLRQMSLDLLNVAASLGSMDLDDDGLPDFDTDNVYFIGHSLGAIDGLPFVAVNNSDEVQNSIFTSQPFIKAAVGLNTGGGVIRLLTNSPSFAPSILGGLAAASDALTQGNSGLESYLNVFQGIMDSADVMNFASTLSDANSTTGVLLTEIIGNSTNPTDQTIPNGADTIWGTSPLQLTVPDTGFVIDGFPAPLAGTEPLVAQFGAQSSASITADGEDAEVIVSRFSDGTHGTPASADNETVFAEFVSQIFQFLNADGNVNETFTTDPTLIPE